MYTDRNFKTKKELKAAVDDYNKLREQGCSPGGTYAVTYYQPGPFGGSEPRDGTIYCEGPHYPKPHKWYATCEVKDGVIVRVK